MTIEQKVGLIERASAFAICAHDSIDHRRKYTNEAYWKHAERVAYLVNTVTNNQYMIAAAWLHDVIEDVWPRNKKYGPQEIMDNFGATVLNLVTQLTDVAKPEDGNRARRKEINRQHLAKISPGAKTIKLADLIDNCLDISKNDQKFYKVFKLEVMQDLPHLQPGNANLFNIFAELLFK